MIIEIPEGDYTYDSMKEFCARFGCKLMPKKRGSASFYIEADEPVKFFWLGANMSLFIDTPLATSTASQVLKIKRAYNDK